MPIKNGSVWQGRCVTAVIPTPSTSLGAGSARSHSEWAKRRNLLTSAPTAARAFGEAGALVGSFLHAPCGRSGRNDGLFLGGGGGGRRLHRRQVERSTRAPPRCSGQAPRPQGAERRKLPTDATPLPSALAPAGAKARQSDRSARRARSGGNCRPTQRPSQVRKEDNRFLRFAHSLRERASVGMTAVTQRPRQALLRRQERTSGGVSASHARCARVLRST
jgi:hypothetical protein